MIGRIIDSSELLAGDILLYRPRHPQYHQRIISKKTNSPYTHAAIYLGNDCIAESTFPCGIRKRPLTKSLRGTLYTAVLRTQLGFGDNRPKKLNEFIESLQKQKHLYDLISVFCFEQRSRKFFENQLEHVFQNYGKFSSNEEFSKRGFFCSAFIVACYCAVGVIDKTAQCAYPSNFFSPAGLYRDPTFGWLMGFLFENNKNIFPIENDPILDEVTFWEEFDDKWWAS